MIKREQSLHFPGSYFCMIDVFQPSIDIKGYQYRCRPLPGICIGACLSYPVVEKKHKRMRGCRNTCFEKWAFYDNLKEDFDSRY